MRLKVNTGGSVRLVECMFLFHIGAIKSDWPRESWDLIDMRFYSTLVRLKANSVGHDVHITDRSFYSTLVRLKARGFYVTKDEVKKFLFHIGAIKRSVGASISNIP